MHALKKSVGLAISLAAATMMAAPAFSAEITGAGSSFVQPLLAKWGSAYSATTPNSINYASIGSGGGTTQIKARTVDFGASDDPMSQADLKTNGLVQFPSVIGAVVMIVNLPGVGLNQMKLTPELVASIYAGKVTKWNDPAIVSINPGLKLRPMPITPIYRSDSSGTTAIFTNYLTRSAKNWSLGAGKSLSWPVGQGGKGNDGVAGNVKNTVGSIGYVEYNYASANKLPMTLLRNADGKFVAANPASFVAAASQADWAHSANGVTNMLSLPGANTWPIVSATYVLVPAKSPNSAKTWEVLNFFQWGYAKGDKMASALGYVPLPAVAVNKVHELWAGVAK